MDSNQILTSRCSRCKLTKLREMFQRNKNAKTGCDGYCRECRREIFIIKTPNTRRRVIPEPGKTHCSECDKTLDNAEFAPSQLKLNQGRKVKRSAYCRKCMAKRRKQPSISSNKNKKYGIRHQSCKKSIADGVISKNQSELAYVAGLFDAEGSVQIANCKDSRVHVCIHNDNEEVLRFAKRVIGGNIYFGKTKFYSENMGVFIVSRGRLVISSLLHARESCLAMIPHLSLKKERCEIISQCINVPTPERVALRQRVWELNKKGVSDMDATPQSIVGNSDLFSKIDAAAYAYLAGAIDGDGWIGFRFSKPCLKISVTKFKFVEAIFNYFGGTITRHEPTTKERAAKYTWSLYIERPEWKIFLARLIPFLVLKKRHAELSLLAIDLPTREQQEIEIQQRNITAFNHEEKFRRIQSEIDIECAKDYVSDFVFKTKLSEAS